MTTEGEFQDLDSATPEQLLREEMVEGEETEEEERDRRRWLPWLVLIIVVLIIWCLLWRQFGKSPDQSDVKPATIENSRVPDVVTLAEADAVSKVEAAGFIAETEVSYDTVAAPGTVSYQTPVGGTLAARGSTVFLGVVAGIGGPGDLEGRDATGIPVPRVIRLTQEAATMRLGRDGFVAAAARVYSDSVPVGLVISQSPVAGVIAPEGSSVRILISKGRSPGRAVIVPNVIGLKDGAAKRRIRAAGLDPRPMWQPNNESVAKAFQQHPEAGDTLPAGEPVFYLIGVAE
jgi:serine/threonine-protein kinase